MSNRKWKCTVLIISSLATVGLTGGCASYVAPRAGADLSVFTGGNGQTAADVSSQEAAQRSDGTVQVVGRKPMAKFPANVVTVRVQEAGYQSYTSSGYGSGRYSVVTSRDIEKDEDFDRIGKLPGIAQVSPISRLLLPREFESDNELRTAAARLQADMVFVYTVDTSFYSQDASTPLSIVSLGLSPTVQVRVVSTVSGLVMDTRSGYIYGTAERTCNAQQAAAFLTTQNAFDQLRLKTERKAFEEFVDEFEVTWNGIVREYQK